MADEPKPRRYGRGLFLVTVAGGLSSLAWGKSVWGGVSKVVSPLAGDIAPILPTQGWRIYSVADHMPTFDPATWRLEVGGLVEKPVSLSYEQLRALPRAEQISTFHCVTGWTVPNVHWAGVRLQHVFDLVTPLPSAGAMQFVSNEQPYTDYLTKAESLLPEVMLAYEMNGKPLSRDHGAPLRLVIPEMYGYKGVKWLGGVNLVTHEQLGYWEQLGYDQDAWIGRSNGYGS
jgi:DMSO/TMAO reductase YedYZ molybdopterin-dependent catalytic subunit